MTDIPDLIAELEDASEICRDFVQDGRGDDIYVARTAREFLDKAIAALRATQWVPIADVPEEWKDGRAVMIWARYMDESGGALLPICYYRSGEFTTPVYGLDEMHVYATHAMLPPSPPTLKDNDHE